MRLWEIATVSLLAATAGCMTTSKKVEPAPVTEKVRDIVDAGNKKASMTLEANAALTPDQIDEGNAHEVAKKFEEEMQRDLKARTGK